MAEDDKTTDTKTEEQAPEKKGRGRPKKPDSEKKTPKNPTGKRGRPPKPESEKKPKPEKKAKAPRGRPKSADSGKPKTHPPVAEMVTTAVAALKDRKGCSLSAVKKYISANFEVDMERQSIFVRRFVRKSLEDGKLVLVKGTSSTGSFKLADPSDSKKAVKTTKSAKSTGKRGRPKGSKNKAGKPKKSPAKKTPVKAGKGTGKRGRPKGSTKKKSKKAE